MPKKRKAAFEKLLAESIDEAFASLGESSRQSIYFHLENQFKIAKEDIPRRLEEFADGLERIFGLGAQFLEILIMKKLYEKSGQPLKWDQNRELRFIEYVETAEQSYT